MLGLSKHTHKDQMRDQLGESWDHFTQGASQVAGELGKSVGPHARRFRRHASRGWDSTAATLAPLAAAYREGAADATATALEFAGKARGHKKGTHMERRSGTMFWVLALGATAGVIGAMLMRRRKQQRWSEYDPTEGYQGGSGTSDMRSAAEKTASKGGEAMDKMSQQAGKAMDKTADKLHSAASSIRKNDFRSDARSKADDTVDAASEAAGNVSAKFNTRP